MESITQAPHGSEYGTLNCAGLFDRAAGQAAAYRRTLLLAAYRVHDVSILVEHPQIQCRFICGKHRESGSIATIDRSIDLLRISRQRAGSVN